VFLIIGVGIYPDPNYPPITLASFI